MISIEPLTVALSPPLIEPARKLLRAYGVFLRETGSHDNFCYDDLEREIAVLPRAYSEQGGEFLLAVEDGTAYGCVAYRAFAQDSTGCELKRLFVEPSHRGSGVGMQLVGVALERARSLGYRMAYLDTDPGAMAAACHTYRKYGFAEYEGGPGPAGHCLLFMRRAL